MKDSLDFLQNYCEEVPDESISEPEFVVHDALNILRTDVICHHGILGMKWGVRRYQNKDGSLTTAGKKRYYRNYESMSYAGSKELTRKGRRALKNKDGSWKDTPAGQVAKQREAEIDKDIAKAKKRDEEKRLKKEKERATWYKYGKGPYTNVDELPYDIEAHAWKSKELREAHNKYDSIAYPGVEKWKKLSETERENVRKAHKEIQTVIDKVETDAVNKLISNAKEKPSKEILSAISAHMDSAVRDNPSLLIYDNKTGKVKYTDLPNQGNLSDSEFKKLLKKKFSNGNDNLSFWTWGEEWI